MEGGGEEEKSGTPPQAAACVAFSALARSGHIKMQEMEGRQAQKHIRVSTYASSLWRR